MSLTTKQIEEQLSDICDDNDMFFSHGKGGGKILWFDKDEGVWCVNGYSLVNGSVTVDPMPSEMFSPSK